MISNKKNEIYKIKREIKMHGDEYIFYRNVLDQYGEDTEQTEEVATIKGLFHMEKGYISSKNSEATQTRGKGLPKILMLYEDSLQLRNKDFVVIEGQKFILTEKNNIEFLGIVTDLSLEVFLDGNN